MKTTDLVNAFEMEWIIKYPYIKFFTVDAVITDLHYWKKDPTLLSIEDRNTLITFLTRYLKEHPKRFAYCGFNNFRVVKNSSPSELKGLIEIDEEVAPDAF